MRKKVYVYCYEGPMGIFRPKVAILDKVIPDIDYVKKEPVVQCDIPVERNIFVDDLK